MILFVCLFLKSLQSCLTLCDPMDCSPPGSSVHGILQARILEKVACPSPGDLPHPGIKPTSLTSPALARWFFPTRATWEDQQFLQIKSSSHELPQLLFVCESLSLLHFRRTTLLHRIFWAGNFIFFQHFQYIIPLHLGLSGFC